MHETKSRREAVNDGPRPALVYGKGRFDEMVPRCDLCLTVSGTATLHVAAFGVPMIVVYRASRWVWELAGRWLVPTRTFALVNVLATRRKDPLKAGLPSGHLVNEFVPWFGDSAPIAELAIDYLQHPKKLAEVADQLRLLVKSGPAGRIRFRCTARVRYDTSRHHPQGLGLSDFDFHLAAEQFFQKPELLTSLVNPACLGRIGFQIAGDMQGRQAGASSHQCEHQPRGFERAAVQCVGGAAG